MLSLLPSEILQDILYHVIELRHEIPISPSSKGRVPFRNKIDTTYHETENCHIYVERRSPSSLPPNSTLLVNHRLHDETLEVMKMKKPLQPFILDVMFVEHIGLLPRGSLILAIHLVLRMCLFNSGSLSLHLTSDKTG